MKQAQKNLEQKRLYIWAGEKISACPIVLSVIGTDMVGGPILFDTSCAR
jgi:hypothetical protein